MVGVGLGGEEEEIMVPILVLLRRIPGIQAVVGLVRRHRRRDGGRASGRVHWGLVPLHTSSVDARATGAGRPGDLTTTTTLAKGARDLLSLASPVLLQVLGLDQRGEGDANQDLPEYITRSVVCLYRVRSR